MKAATWLIKVLLWLALLSAAAGSAVARDYAEIQAEINAARGNIESAGKSISAAAVEVGKAIEAIKTAENFEGPHWGKLEQSVQNWSSTLEQQSRNIDSNARAILSLDPGASVYLQEPAYYGAELRSLRDQMKQLQADLLASIVRAQQTQQRQHQVKQAVVEDIKSGVVDLTTSTALDVLGVPTSLEDAAGSAVLSAAEAAGKWFAKPLDMANTGIKFAVGFYYLADEAKSGARALKSANEVNAFADEFINKTRANIASAQQGIDIVNRLWQQGDDARSKFNQTQSGWRQASEAAAKKQTQEMAENFEKELAKPEANVGVATYWPAPQAKPIAASEFQPEVEAILRELRSAALAATDGGSPVAYQDIKRGHQQRLNRQIEAAQTRRDATADALQQAAGIYYGICEAAWHSYLACSRGCSGLAYDAANRCWASCSATLNATVTAAQASVVPAATAHTLAERELTRLRQIGWRVQDHSGALEQMLDAAAMAARSRYYLLWAEQQRQFEDELMLLYASLVDIPTPSTLDYYKQQPSWIASDMGFWLSDAAGMRSRINDTAQRLRDAGAASKKAIAEYQASLPKAQQLAQKAQAQLSEFINKYGSLMIVGGYATSYSQSQVDEYIEGYRKHFQSKFQISPLDYLAAAGAFPFEATAQEVERWLPELDLLIGRIDTFNYRLSNANAALHQASRALTGKSAYAQRGEGAQEEPVHKIVLKELTSGVWAGFAAAVNSLAQQDNGLVLPQTTGYSPRRLLLTLQSAFLNQVNEQMRAFAEAQRSGRFALVDAKVYERMNKLWQSFKPLYAQHEAIAAPLRKKLNEGSQLLPNEASLQNAFNLIPQRRQQLVQARYQRYRVESSGLRSYVAQMQEALDPIADPQRNNVMSALQALIEGYPDAKVKWEKQQAAAQALYERQMAEQRRLQAAQELARRQQEAQAQRAAQAGVTTVQKLYQDFVAAYQSRNLSALLRYMSDDWSASDGSDLRDLEDILSNSFRVFDQVVFALTGLNIQPAGEGRYNVSYSATITGYINQMNLKHQETAEVQDTVILTPTGAKIQQTHGGRIWLKP